MYRKNTAGQFVCFQMLLTATGAIATGLSPAVRRCIDGTFAAGGGTVTEDTGTGSYKYAMSQADTNGNNISFIFSVATAMPVCVNIVTTAADPTDSVRFGLTALPNAAAGANGGLPTGNASGQVTVVTNNDKTGYSLIVTPPTADQNADALLDRSAGIETNRTVRQGLRLMLSALCGKLSGAATTQVIIRDTNDTGDRIVADVDANGNRTFVTLNSF